MQEIDESTVKVIAGPEKKSHKVSDHDKKLTAYHEAGHAICTAFTETPEEVHQISIIPRAAQAVTPSPCPLRTRATPPSGRCRRKLSSFWAVGSLKSW